MEQEIKKRIYLEGMENQNDQAKRFSVMMLGDIQSEILELLPLVTGVCHKYFEQSDDAGKD